MDARRGISLAVILAAVVAGAAEVPRSLASRMLDAREGFAPPAKTMRLAPEPGGEKIDWPLNVARIEGMLEKRLDRAADGAYLLRYVDNRERSPRERAEDALAYVNKVFAEWAVIELNAKFPRCDADTVRALAGYRVDMDGDFWSRHAVLTDKGVAGGGSTGVKGWVAGWKVADRIYLLLTSDLSVAGHPRDYQFVMWDGRRDWPIAGFSEPPDAARARTVLRVLDSGVAANNLAVLLHSREANRSAYMPQYLEQLLRRAATDGCEAAFYNLGVLMEEQGDHEQAAAFFSRGGAKTGD